MRRNCNLELCLFPRHDSSGQRHPNMLEENSDLLQSPIQNYFQHRQHQEQQLHPLTIFYDGKICAADVTELQAKSILMLANNTEMQERMKRTSGSSEPCTPTTMVQSPNQLYSPGSDTGLSMKRSLQRFLQKRNNRVQQASPYYHY